MSDTPTFADAIVWHHPFEWEGVVLRCDVVATTQDPISGDWWADIEVSVRDASNAYRCMFKHGVRYVKDEPHTLDVAAEQGLRVCMDWYINVLGGTAS